ncbi:inorganic phosphate transporter [Bacillus sp. S10(2024)]|uniref:inorganic phosphate transporter n=1 Tax=Bacillus sp. S10(2024) TaxID=3162886 RepID=UPI003D2120AB
MVIVAFSIALFFAMNIGASGGAAAMGVTYASGAIRSKFITLLLCGIAIILGSVIQGQEIVKTISSGIIPENLFTVKVVILILIAASLSLFLANLFGIPLSTSEITIGAVAGVGIAYHVLFVKKLLFIVSFWILTPILAFSITFFTGKFIYYLRSKYPNMENGKLQPVFTILIIFAGLFEAYSAGMKNVANAIGPLVGAHLISLEKGSLIGGIFVALGALFLGRRVIETNGKKITSISILEGIVTSSTTSLLVITAATYGIPLPITQITSSSIIGIGAVQEGVKVFQKKVVIQMLKVWAVAPFISFLLSYTFIKILMKSNLYTVFIVIAIIIAIIGILVLLMKLNIVKNREVY